MPQFTTRIYVPRISREGLIATVLREFGCAAATLTAMAMVFSAQHFVLSG